MKELSINPNAIKPSSFFSEESKIMENVVANEFGIQTRVYIFPRLGIHQDVQPDIFPNGVSKGIMYENSIHIFPEFSEAFKTIISNHFVEVPGIMDALNVGINNFIADTNINHELPLLHQNLCYMQSCIENYQEFHDITNAYIIAALFNELKGYDTEFDALYAAVVQPLLTKPNHLKDILIKMSEPIIAHEAAHVWSIQFTQGEKLNKHETEYVNSFITKDLLEDTGFIEFLKSQKEEDIVSPLRNHRIEKLKLILNRIPNKELHEKIAFTYLWSGLEEDLVRAICFWKTNNINQLYDNITLIIYYGSARKIVWKGNRGIQEFHNIAENYGLEGLQEYVFEQKKEIYKEVATILSGI